MAGREGRGFVGECLQDSAAIGLKDAEPLTGAGFTRKMMGNRQNLETARLLRRMGPDAYTATSAGTTSR